MGLTPSYRPDVVESFATRLEARARSVAIGATAFGSLLGGSLGAVPLTPLDTVWHLPAAFGFGTALGGALVGGLAGAAIGGAATGRASGALAGAAVGAVGGAVVGAATAPPPDVCPYGVYRGRDGLYYCAE